MLYRLGSLLTLPKGDISGLVKILIHIRFSIYLVPVPHSSQLHPISSQNHRQSTTLDPLPDPLQSCYAVRVKSDPGSAKYLLCITIPHKTEPIAIPQIRDVVILPPDIAHDLQEMQSTPGIDCRHRPMGLAVLKPTPACAGPHQPLHELVCVVVEILDCLGFRLDGLYPLGLDLFDDLEDVARVPFQDGQD
jgi:hypothetical protein